MRHQLAVLLTDETGQDLIEYALLAATIGFAGVVGFDWIGTAMNSTYQTWDAAVQSDALVEPQCPISQCP